MKYFWILALGCSLLLGCTEVTHQSIEAPGSLRQPIAMQSAVYKRDQDPPGVPSPPMDTTMVPGVRFGAVTAKTTLADLKRLYGASNVVAGEYYVEEGQCESGTRLFPRDKAKTVQILWGDTRHQAYPIAIQLLGDRTVWKTADGITLGTTARKLLKLNNAPFKFGGFGWDYGGYVTSWNKGNLEKLLGRSLLVRLDVNPASEASPNLEGVTGEGQFSSDAIRAFADQIVVSRLVFYFPENTVKYPDNGENQHDCKEN